MENTVPLLLEERRDLAIDRSLSRCTMDSPAFKKNDSKKGHSAALVPKQDRYHVTACDRCAKLKVGCGIEVWFPRSID